MPKKKKGKKKGGKKKVGKKTKKEPKLSQVERFLQFQVASRSDACEANRNRRDEYLKHNADLRAKLNEKIGRRNAVVGTFYKESLEGENVVRHAEESCDEAFRRTLGEKEAAIAKEKAEVAALKQRLQNLIEEVTNQTNFLQGLEDHKRSLQHERKKEIDLLSIHVEDVKTDFQKKVKELDHGFQVAKDRFEAHLLNRLEKTKERACATALENQSNKDQVVFLDNAWLKRELATHVAESERLEEVCRMLEKKNLGLLHDIMPHSKEEPNSERWSSVENYKSHAEQLLASDDDSEDESEDGSSGEESDNDDETDEPRGSFESFPGNIPKSQTFHMGTKGTHHKKHMPLSRSLHMRSGAHIPNNKNNGKPITPRSSNNTKLVIFPKLVDSKKPPALSATFKKPANSAILNLPVLRATTTSTSNF